MRKALFLLLILTCSFSYSQNVYLRGGLITQRYISDNGALYLPGIQLSAGTNQKDSKFNLDFSYTPINTNFQTVNGTKAILYEEKLDTLVNYSAQGIFSFRFSAYAFIFSKSHHSGSLAFTGGVDKPLGDRKNTLPELDVKDYLGSLNIGAFGEYQYMITQKHSVFINAGVGLHLFGILGNSSIYNSRKIKGLRPIKEVFNIGYSYVILGK